MSDWNPEVNEIFAKAIELESPEQRQAFLEQACGTNDDMRAAVDRLLQAHNDAGSFLHKPPSGLSPTIATRGHDSSDEVSLDFLSPTDKPHCLGTLGQYEVVEVVGRGGMGIVLRAYDKKLNRVVAIKVMAAELAANPMAVTRFLREARAVAAVSHEHVVTIHAIEEDKRPPFIVMEFVDGKSLQDKINQNGELKLKEILRVGMQTARGLAAAHEQGLVHRDIKPANILLENGIERVKLTDFGLARAADDVSVTKTGQIAGTPQYMSPEQAEGRTLDSRSDLFSLGSVLYAMCTGGPPFRADSAVAMLRSVADDDPQSIRVVNAELPDWLEDIIFKLLAKNPEDRFGSADEVASLLGQHLAHLQQPSSVSLPEPVSLSQGSVASGQADAATPETTKRLKFVRNVLGGMGLVSLLWCFACLAFPYHGAMRFGFTMPSVLLSLVTGALALVGAWNAMHRQSYGWTVVGCIALLFPVNIPQMLGLLLVIWTSALLWRDDVRLAFASALASPSKQDERHWLRRIPVPAWIALLLFGVVYFSAITEWTGISHELGSRPNGIGFFLIATGFVFLWGLISLLGGWLRGRSEKSLHPPRRVHLVAFFSLLTITTGIFVWNWTELSNPMERSRMLGFFVGHGSITLRLNSADTSVVFNGASVDVPEDGVVVLRPKWPGSFVYTIRREDGTLGGGDFIIYKGLNADIGIGVFDGAESVTVTGPIRGSFDQVDDDREANPSERVAESSTAMDDRWVNLISLADRDDGESGSQWSFRGNKLTLLSGEHAALKLPVDARPHYEVRSRFYRIRKGGSIKFWLPVRGGHVELSFNDWFKYHGIQYVNGQMLHQRKQGPALVTGKQFVVNERHEMTARIDDQGTNLRIAVTLDDEELFTWTGAAEMVLHRNPLLHLDDSSAIYIGTGTSPGIVWETINLRVLSGDLASEVSDPVAARQRHESSEPVGFSFVPIPSGTFEMGTATRDVERIKPDADWFFADFVLDRRESEIPQHSVTITKPIEMSAHEVTVGQFRQFVEATGYKSTAEREGEGYGWWHGEWLAGPRFHWRDPGFTQTDDHPVCNVSWNDATAFCRWLSAKAGATYRLPTEAEWEYACRAGTTTLFSTGDDPNSLQGAANLADASMRQAQTSISWVVGWDDGFANTAPVGSYQPNAFGLYDMHGNAWEWCEDVYDVEWYTSSRPAAIQSGEARRTSMFFEAAVSTTGSDSSARRIAIAATHRQS